MPSPRNIPKWDMSLSYNRICHVQSIYSKEYKAFLKRLRAKRLELGKTQVGVARSLRKPQSFVSKIESGERRLGPLELKAVAKLYGVSVDWLLSGRKGR